ncbi:MAG TPA: hypothetical protein PKX87_06090 [Alphaproteobacteria bacterium]|nr:hypothetical protein [Alphaproteobacteria bacterium]
MIRKRRKFGGIGSLSDALRDVAADLGISDRGLNSRGQETILEQRERSLDRQGRSLSRNFSGAGGDPAPIDLQNNPVPMAPETISYKGAGGFSDVDEPNDHDTGQHYPSPQP